MGRSAIPALGPVLLCYDGSEPAKRAIGQAGAVLEGEQAVVLTVWESLGSAVLRHRLPGASQVGQDVRQISEDVIEELDADVAADARATAAEGAQLAERAGFQARPLAHRALGGLGERGEVTVWQAVLAVAEEEDAAVVVLGARGRSQLRSALLGSVSYGIVHHSARPILVVPPFPD